MPGIDSVDTFGIFIDTMVLHFLDTCRYNNIGKLCALDSVIAVFEKDSGTRRVETLIDMNDDITATNTVEATHKVVNDIRLKTLLSEVETFTTQQLQDLWEISQSCPSVQGMGVYTARALLGIALDTVLDYPDTCAVETENLRRDFSAGEPPISLLQIYPNPADRSIIITYHNPYDLADGKTEMFVFDALGKEMSRLALTDVGGTVQLNTSAWPGGVYVVRWTDNGGKQHSAKFVISR